MTTDKKRQAIADRAAARRLTQMIEAPSPFDAAAVQKYGIDMLEAADRERDGFDPEQKFFLQGRKGE